MLDDVAIIQRILNGDETAFATLVRRYQGMVFALAYHYLKDFQDAEEVSQDVFLKVYRSLDTLEDPRRFSNWLRRIVYTEAMMRLRAHKRPATLHLETEGPEIISQSLRQYEEAQRRSSVVEALEELAEELRLIVELRYLGGYTSREIGEMLGMKPGTVRYRLHRAIKSLREVFQVVESELQSRRLAEDFAEDILKSLGRLEGKVVGINGEPLGNIRLYLDQLLPGKGIYSSGFIRVDADGRFSLDIPNWGRHREGEADTGEFHIGLYGPIGEAIRHANVSVTLKIGEQARDIVLDLRKGAYPLRVRVIGPEGDPVEGARVTFHVRYPGRGGHGFNETYDGREMRHFLTDADGLTSVLHLSALHYTFEVIAEGYRKFDVDSLIVKVPDEIPDGGILPIRLEPGGRIAGRVFDSEGAPVSNAKVALRSYRSDGRSWMRGRYINLPYTAPDDVFTDDEGRFAFTTLEPVGRYSLHAYHEEHGVDCLLDVPVGREDAVLRLMPTTSLCGRLLKGSKPVAILEEDFDPVLGDRIQIDFVEGKGQYSKFNDRRVRPFRACRIHIFTDESGLFRVDHLFPGATYRLTIIFEGKEHVYTVTLREDGETHMNFNLT